MMNFIRRNYGVFVFTFKKLREDLRNYEIVEGIDKKIRDKTGNTQERPMFSFQVVQEHNTVSRTSFYLYIFFNKNHPRIKESPV